MKVGGIAKSFPAHYPVCVHDLAQLTISEFYCFSLINRNRYASVPAEIFCSLAPNIKKHCTSQCFVLGFLITFYVYNSYLASFDNSSLYSYKITCLLQTWAFSAQKDK